MKNSISLKVRQGFILVFFLVIALPMMFYSIGRAYFATLIESTEQTLQAHTYSLIANIQIENGELAPFYLQTPDLIRLNSDVFAYVYIEGEPAWASDSSLNHEMQPQQVNHLPGEPVMQRVGEKPDDYWQMSFIFFMDAEGKEYQITIYLMRSNKALLELMDNFRNTLFDWLIIMAVAITGLMILGFIWSGRPLKRLDKEIVAIESGQATSISLNYPIELNKIKEDLNLLLSSQQRQKEKYRGSLSDLAHALKTPLAVIRSSELAQDKDAQEQLDRISGIIEHQLKRAASGGTDTWKKRTSVKPVTDSICNAMHKVYRDKDIQFITKVPEESYFLGDKTDLLELLGNLIDNACKACDSLIEISVVHTEKSISLTIGDDGPGIAEEQKDLLTVRGQRLDTYEQGHGVGMAIVNDLVESYQGTMKISTSPLGGAQFTIEFNYV